MKKFTVDEIQNKFDTLPKTIKDAITSPEVNDTVISLAEKHGLKMDQLTELVDLIGLVMLGFVSSKEFVKEFSNEANVSEEIARAIAEDINKEVFEKIRTAMRETDQQKTPENLPNRPKESLEPVTKQPIQRPIYSSFQQTYKPKPAHITDLEKAGDFIIENDSNPTFEERIPARPVNFSSPVKQANPIPVEEPTIPKNNEPQPTIPIPSITENKPEKTFNEEKTNLSIPKTTDQVEITENDTKPDVTFETNGTENNLKTRTTEEKDEQTPYKEPLADHLLEMLNDKPENNNQAEEIEEKEIKEQTLTPDNLPIMEEIKDNEPLKATETIPQVPTNQERPRTTDMYREPVE